RLQPGRSEDPDQMSALAIPALQVAAETLPPRRRIGFWRRLLRHRMAFAGLIFILLITVAAIVTPWVSPYDAYKMQLASAQKSPSLSHPLGTDKLGRDTLTRVFVGGRVSIEVSLAAVAISSGLGALL